MRTARPPITTTVETIAIAKPRRSLARRAAAALGAAVRHRYPAGRRSYWRTGALVTSLIHFFSIAGSSPELCRSAIAA